ncbi:hypothetical protein GIB67_008420 [Kingdonia uniflora]|uniref:Thioredoxin-like fold domain-containing protein MRL7, chloroplastic n=1 Tax=Kingdonia uniflora TaxID=39325 RepID=A0A7J7N516_9MAGN|nr:hypothetical protein GIB67_008420 [Kingdonia uniflora]
MNLLQTLSSKSPLTTLSAFNTPFSSPIPPNTCSHYYPRRHTWKLFPLFAISANSDPNQQNPSFNAKFKQPLKKTGKPQSSDENEDGIFPKTIPRKPRRGRKSEATAVEDYVRDSLGRTFESIRQQNSEVFEEKDKVLKDKIGGEDDEGDDEDVGGKVRRNKMVVEEEDPNWPLDADVGWGMRASEYFDKHSIKNVVGEDGVEIDWEGEVDDNYVNEINCLEWESFAFHPSPLIVLVFERYNRAAHNWKLLKELEKAIKVYWDAKDRLPPRTVKIDINIERDLAYALKVQQCPQLLFLRGNTVLCREKEIRSADELVQMIAHFYYNAKKPSWIDDAALTRR